MFGRLVQKEILNQLLDFRFVVVFVLCAALAALAAYIGSENYAYQLDQHTSVSEKNDGAVRSEFDLTWNGHRWNRRPEVLSAVVFGLSGDLGQEVLIQYRRLLHFEASLFATDPIHALFGILDLAFVVKVVLSLCVLVFTYDAICGEKEAGTLRLCASFPVPRWTLALAKLTGGALAMLLPLVLAFLLVSLVLALLPTMDLTAQDWARAALLMCAFALYLTVFSAFGLCLSALSHRRMTAFLGLLGLWTAWLFVVPNLGIELAHRLAPSTSVYDLERRVGWLKDEILKDRQAEMSTYWQRQGELDWDALPKARKEELLEGESRIDARSDDVLYARLGSLKRAWRNALHREEGLARVLSSLSPLSAVSMATMDLARTGPAQQEQIETALDGYLIQLADFIHVQQARVWEDREYRTYPRFTFRPNGSVGECLARNAMNILNLILLAILGFAGAYVAILRYDVR
jgi:ABC-type transport system involved in multi-copper enzyme maturation permease subunit